MSKTLLKKELQSFTKDQLIELVLETYSVRKEFKEYFEFFVDPKPAELYDKCKAEVVKELRRSKWGHSKARISKVYASIKRFISFSPGSEWVMKLYLAVIAELGAPERWLRYSDTLYRGAQKIVASYLNYAESNSSLDEAIKSLEDYFKTNGELYTKRYMRTVRDAVADYIESSRTNLK